MCNFVAVHYNTIITQYNMNYEHKTIWAIRATQGNNSMITKSSRGTNYLLDCFATREAAEVVMQYYKSIVKYVNFKIVKYTEDDN